MRGLRAAGLALVTMVTAVGCGPAPVATMAAVAPPEAARVETAPLALSAPAPVDTVQRQAAQRALAVLAEVEAFARQSVADEAGLSRLDGRTVDNGDGSHTETWSRTLPGGEESWTRVGTAAAAQPLKLEHVRRTETDAATLSQRRIKVWLADGGYVETWRVEHRAGRDVWRADLTTQGAADGTWATHGSLTINGTHWVVAKLPQGEQASVTLREARSGIAVQGVADAGQDLQTAAVRVSRQSSGTK